MSKLNLILSLLSSTLIGSSIFASSVTAGVTKVELRKNVEAVIVAAAGICLTDRYNLNTDQSFSALVRSLKKANLYDQLSFLQTPNGTKAMKILASDLQSDCKTLKSGKKTLARISPLFLD